MEEIKVVLNLSKTADEYTFSFDRRPDIPILHIPGEHRGPDLCFPYKPEQEKWLNSLNDILTPFWYCQWIFRNAQMCDKFFEYLKRIRDWQRINGLQHGSLNGPENQSS